MSLRSALDPRDDMERVGFVVIVIVTVKFVQIFQALGLV